MTTKKQPETDPTPVPACRRGRTLVVDDSPAFPDSFCAYPETLTGLEVVGTADNRRDGVVKSETLRPDLLLLPLDMPVVNGLNAATQVRREFPALRVVVMSVRDEPVWATASEQACAHAFVSKHRWRDELPTALRDLFPEATFAR